MTGRLTLFTLISMVLTCGAASAIDPEYHTNDEIYEQIVAWQDSLPDFVRVDTIGYSQRDHLPIWAVKLSYNVNEDEDEPTVLFVGQVHAEELIGVEITLALIDTLLTYRYMSFPIPYAIWLGTMEIWVIPTLNPEGHQVVMDEWDVSFRKNKSDCNNNGIFDYDNTALGGDIDGVDINRNFPLNWVHGDSFLQISLVEPYDYFRGFAPLSESETQALWDFNQQQKFSFSIVWHSSRQGGLSESVFYPWEWDPVKVPPDFATISWVGTKIAQSIPKTTSGYYVPSATQTAAGNQHDSFYAFFGTLAYLIEAGPGSQSSYPIAEEVIEANFGGAHYLLNRAAGTGDLVYYSQITGLVTDAATTLPLTAEVKIFQLHNEMLMPRTCDPTYGRYRRYLMPGYYDVEARMRGYYPQIAQVTANPGGPSFRNFALEPKDTYSFHGEVHALEGDPIAATIYIHGEDVLDTLNVSSSGQFSHNLPEGDYTIIFDSPGYVVRFDELSLTQNRYIIFELSPSVTLVSDDFEGGLSQWNADGTDPQLVRWGTEAADSLWAGGMVATESPYADYLPEVENWIELATPLDLSGQVTASLKFQHWYYFEPGNDSGFVEVSADGGNVWNLVSGPYWGQDIGWGTGYGSLDPYCGLNEIHVRWRIGTDASLQEQGWRIDDIEIMAADTADSVQPDPELPREFAIYSVYPNPFNANLSILLDLPFQQDTRVTILDVAGRRVDEIHSGMMAVGKHRLIWETPANNPSGIYFVEIETEKQRKIKKVLYLK